MLVIVYDPYNGVAVPDAKVANAVENMLNYPDSVFYVGNSIILDEIRLRIVRGQIPHTHVKFVYQHKDIFLNQYGNPIGDDGWPKDIFYHSDDLTSRILTAQMERRRRDNPNEQTAS